MESQTSPRLCALGLVAAGHRAPEVCAPEKNMFESFGEDVFSQRLMRERLPKEVYVRLKNIGHGGRTWAPYDADVVASAMKDWALSRGATHYTHWFQPMTGLTAEKHDSFVTPLPDGVGAISEFSGKHLVKGEPDASSFPSGGLRSTFEARGYTAWDPTSPAFVLRHSGTVTLCIPSVYYSYTGESLDRKTPLLRSINALSSQAVRMMKLLGYEDCTSVIPQVGVEQEYFLVDRRLYSCRPDLVMSGRTLFGARPAKGQQMEDHFFAAIPKRILAFMSDVEKRLFALGVPMHTRHNEVAPCQYEAAPIYESCNVATDHNMLTMEVLARTAGDHDLACLLHEKPFRGVNGSGKHNNWSISDNTGRNIMEPGPNPRENLPFLLVMAAIMRAMHLHSPIWRIGTVGASNDHRLGASEAPPAIISAYIGQELEDVIDSIITGCDPGDDECKVAASRRVDLGVSALPELTKDSADRNRTSPMAFTGNKFEFRALGSSQSTATINIAINTTVAKTIGDICEAIEDKVAEGKSGVEAAWEVLPKFFKEHRGVLFNGDNYSDEWAKEAERRGLPNLRDSVQALALYDTPEIISVFESQKVLSQAEVLARQHILLEDYIGRLLIEADLTSRIAATVIKPVALKWLGLLAEVAKDAKELAGENAEELAAYKDVRTIISELNAALKDLDEAIKTVEACECGPLGKAESARDRLLPNMSKVREQADRLEMVVDSSLWPMPTYADIFWSI
ncbi:glutamine synthetase type III [Deltaproteobacteria bacterium Smac51]|nr:glutamine synthetase type III [Deltaproteobacteria bacterium Smac51]